MFKRLLVLCVLAVAVSSASFSIKAPAVDSSGNGVISIISVQVVNGSGMVYTNVENSLVTTDTENSMRTAAQVGAGYTGANFNNYNYYFNIQSNASEVDGPSAGLAFTLGVIQDFFIIQNSSKTFRTDFTVTGTINPDGSTGVVGGVNDKILAASGRVELMLIPSGQSLLDGVDYVSLGSGLNKSLQVVEVANVSQAVGFLLTPNGSVLKGVPSHSLTVLSPVVFNFSNSTLPMKEIAILQIQSAENDLSKLALNYSNNATIAVLNQTLGQALNLTGQGYFYTAANSAFLVENQIDSILLGNVSSQDFQFLIESLFKNMSSFNFTRMNSNNFEWVAGGELRYFWALEELNQVNSSFAVLQTPSFFVNDYVTAKNWFEAAVDLNNLASGISGPSVNDFNARSYALNVLNESAVFKNSSAEAFFHYNSSLAEFNSGDYVASSMDAMFVFAYSNQSLNFTSSYPSVWAEVYNAQGFYNEQFYNLTGSQSSESNFIFLSSLSTLLKGNAFAVVKSFSTPLQVNKTLIGNNTNNTIQVQTIASYTPLVAFNYLWIGVVVIIVVLIFLIVMILSSKTEKKPEEIIDKFDIALAEGRISEKTHEKLVKKWSEKIKNKQLILKTKRKG
jgi:predicted S18 family serine protease